MVGLSHPCDVFVHMPLPGDVAGNAPCVYQCMHSFLCLHGKAVTCMYDMMPEYVCMRFGMRSTGAEVAVGDDKGKPKRAAVLATEAAGGVLKAATAARAAKSR